MCYVNHKKILNRTYLAKAAGAELPVTAIRVLGNGDVFRLDLPGR